MAKKGIWLRGDLEGLSDELLAQKLQVLGDERDELLRKMTTEKAQTMDFFDNFDNALDGSASLRHPAYYQLIGMGTRSFIVFAMFNNATVSDNDFKKIQIKIMSCGILDILTELERRVKRKNSRWFWRKS